MCILVLVFDAKGFSWFSWYLIKLQRGFFFYFNMERKKKVKDIIKKKVKDIIKKNRGLLFVLKSKKKNGFDTNK